MNPPEEIVAKVGVGRLLKPDHRCTLRVHSAQYVVDDSVLTGRIERLQYDQQRMLFLRVEEELELAEFLQVPPGLGLGLLLGGFSALIAGSILFNFTLVPGSTTNSFR